MMSLPGVVSSPPWGWLQEELPVFRQGGEEAHSRPPVRAKVDLETLLLRNSFPSPGEQNRSFFALTR